MESARCWKTVTGGRMRDTRNRLQVPRKKTHRQPANPPALRSTDVQRRFGRVLDKVLKGRDIVITRRGARLAVLVSLDRYNGLVSALGNAGSRPRAVRPPLRFDAD